MAIKTKAIISYATHPWRLASYFKKDPSIDQASTPTSTKPSGHLEKVLLATAGGIIGSVITLAGFSYTGSQGLAPKPLLGDTNPQRNNDPFYGEDLVGDLTAYQDYLEKVARTTKMKPQGFEAGALSSEKLKHRSTDYENLKTISDSLKLPPAIAKYAKPAVVVVHSENGNGTGFIYSSNKTSSIIVTNDHVVDSAEKVKIILCDGKEEEGKIVGIDSSTDLVAIKINKGDLPTLKLAIEEPLVGDFVAAMGNPGGLNWSFTTGIISAKGRMVPVIKNSDKEVLVFQIDAAINPGNSGGPLLNRQGDVVGVNQSIMNRFQNISFTIPAETVNRVIPKLIEGKSP